MGRTRSWPCVWAWRPTSRIAVLQTSLEQVIVIGVILQRTVKGFGRLQTFLQQAVIVESPFKEVETLIAELSANQEDAGGTVQPQFEWEIRCESLRFAYGKRNVLNGASLAVPAGSITVLTGMSGAGKTTLIDLVLGLHRPQSGRILIDDVDLAQIELQAWRAMVGYVPQELILFHASILENLTLSDSDHSEGAVDEALRLAGADGVRLPAARGGADRCRHQGCQALRRPAPADRPGSRPDSSA